MTFPLHCQTAMASSRRVAGRDKTMKILFFTENSYCGGLDSFLVTLADHWPSAGDELVLLCNRNHPGLEVIRRRVRRPLKIVGHDLPMAAAWLERLRRLPGGRWLAKAASPALRYLVFLLQVRRVGALLRAVDPGRLMIGNGGYPAGDSCRAAAIAWDRLRGDRPKAVHNVHNLAYPPRRWDALPEGLIDRRVGKASLAFVAVSRACAASLPANRPDAAGQAPVIHVYNGIAEPPPVAASGWLRAELGVAAGTPLALMLGTYEPRKGHAFLIAAWRRVYAALPGAQLVICGHGTPAERAHVADLVKRAGLAGCVHLFGFRDDVAGLLAETDVLVVAAQAFESFGLTLVEAMAQRVPVVATAVGGIPEVVGDDEAGFVVAPDDEAGYADRVAALLADPALRRRIGERGFARYHRLFTACRMAEEYARLIRQTA